jgi:hypothetical protein
MTRGSDVPGADRPEDGAWQVDRPRHLMISTVRRTAFTLLAGAALTTAVAFPASAQTAAQNGLVNVAVGDVNVLNDANIGVAAQVAANLCGLEVGPDAVLATQVDASGATSPVSSTPTGPVTIPHA